MVQDRSNAESGAMAAKREAMTNAFQTPPKAKKLPVERLEVLASREARKDANDMVEKFLQLKAEGEATIAKREATLGEYEEAVREGREALAKLGFGAGFGVSPAIATRSPAPSSTPSNPAARRYSPSTPTPSPQSNDGSTGKNAAAPPLLQKLMQHEQQIKAKRNGMFNR